MLKKTSIIFIILLALGSTGAGFYISKWERREPVFEVHFFHLNRGRSIFLRTPLGKTILIDGGQNSEVVRELSKVLPFYRRRIDTVIVTSALAKNVGGLAEVLERYEVENVFLPGIMGTSTALSAFKKVVERKNIPVQRVLKGDVFAIDSLDFKVLFPDPLFKFNKTSTPELVLRVHYASTTLVFLGDVSPTIQKSLMSELESVYLIEYAHAAAKSRISAAFLSTFDPEIVVSSKREETLRYTFK